MGAFFLSCGHYSTERELLAILRRIDTDGDARLSFAEFSEFMTIDGGPVPEPQPPLVEEPRDRRSNSPLR
jgi:Ca2+-binding EF-hand superfamily protein